MYADGMLRYDCCILYDLIISCRPLPARAATIGLIIPISFLGLRSSGSTPNVWWIKRLLRWPSAALLAVHHINTRDASIVGEDTLSRIPPHFTLAFKLKNSDFSAQGAAEALMAWTSCRMEESFADDVCHFLETRRYLDGNATAGITPAVGETCESTLRIETSTAAYEASSSQNIHAIVGVPSSSSAKIVSTIGNLHKLPVMSFGAADSALEDKAMYPLFSRTNARSAPMFRAIVGVVKHFGWKAINILNSGSTRVLGQTSELLLAARAAGITVASTHIFTNTNSESIQQAVTSLAAAMRNSSSVTRTRVTVLIIGSGDAVENLNWVLEHGAQQQIMGEGFVWINADDVGIRNVIDTTKTITPQNRLLFAGFLNM